MIRILFDEYGDAHHYIFLKVDATPSFLQMADSFYLDDFLAKECETMEDLVLVYLNYRKQKIQNLDDKETFIPFYLSGQYIGGLFVSKGKTDC